jgi:toxin ParE1/3/4
VARFRLSGPARTDLMTILGTSMERWGAEGRRRYAAALAAAMRHAASDPQGRVTRDRADLLPGMRSLHLRHARADADATGVGRPIHILFYRVVEPGLVEIVRVMHERMEPSRHLGDPTPD